MTPFDHLRYDRGTPPQPYAFTVRQYTPTVTAGPDLSYIYNLVQGPAGNLAKWYAKRAKVIAGTGRARVLFVGDSKTMGAGAGTTDGSTFTVGAAPFTKSRMAGDLLAARGITTNYQSTVGMYGLGSIALLKNYDARITGLASWVVGNLSVGGRLIRSDTANVDTYAFSPNGTADTVEVAYITGTASGTFTVKDGASTIATIDTTAGANGFVKQANALSTRDLAKTINFNRTVANTNSIHLGLILATDSLTPAVDIINAGWYGSKTGDWNSAASPWSPLNGIQVYAPDLTFISLGANDMNTSVALATSRANTQAIITAAKITGDVVLVNQAMGSQPTWGDAATQAAYRAMQVDLMTNNNCPLLDEDQRFGGFTAANALGYFADGIHENAIGNAILAPLYANVMSA